MKIIKLTSYHDPYPVYYNAETITYFCRHSSEKFTLVYYGADRCCYVKETEEEILELINKDK